MRVQLHIWSKKVTKEMRYDERIHMTEANEVSHENANNGYICEEIVDEEKCSCRKVRDHDHRTGAYRGAAHSKCNITYYSNRHLPDYFHSLSGYGSHHIIKEAYNIRNELSEMKPYKYKGEYVRDENGHKMKRLTKPKISAIPNSYEKIMSFGIGDLKFTASLRFMASI